MAKQNTKNLAKKFIGKPLPQVDTAIGSDATAVKQQPVKKKQIGNYKKIDSQFADAFRDIVPAPDNVAQLLAKKYFGDARMSNASLDDQQKVMLWDVMQNAKKRTGKSDGGTEYQDYGGIGYGDSEQYNNWFNRGNLSDLEAAYQSFVNPGFKLGSTIGRGRYWSDPENPDKMYYTDVYDWNTHEKNFAGKTNYQKLRNSVREGEDKNLNAQKNENFRMNFELDAKEIEELRKKVNAENATPFLMESGGWLDKYNDGGPVQPNYNDASVSYPDNFVGDGYDTTGRNYSPAWGGQFAMGGSMPGAVGFTYARTGGIPSNGPYAKKTKASAQDGANVETIYSGMLPEITVVGSKDPQTEEFYRTMLDRLTKEEGSNYGIMENNDIYSDPNPETFNMVFDNPISTNNILGRYQGLMDLGKKYGFPKVHPKDANSIFAIASKLSDTELESGPRPNYNPFTKTIQASTSKNWLDEMAHHVQFKNNPISTGSKFLTNDVPAYIFGKSPYRTLGTMEHEAHSIIEPKLEEEVEKSKSKYKQLPYIQKLTEQFYGPVENYQNGGEMRYYQEGLDFQPKTISRNGSVIQDDMGQYNHPGEITEIGSNQITMQGVPYPVLGISDTGDTQMMYPNEDYTYDGSSVTEYPMMKQGGQLTKLDQLTNFTNYNTKQPGGWLDKYQD
jgi:hypothetical protein